MSNVFDESKIRRQGAGSSKGGQFAAKSNSAPAGSLGQSNALGQWNSIGRDTFEKYSRPRDSDFTMAYGEVEKVVRARPENSWDAVLGAGARRTKANRDKHDAHIRRQLNNGPDYDLRIQLAKDQAPIRAYARMYDDALFDVEHPAATAQFEEHWNNPYTGGAAMQREYDTLTERIERLKSGADTPLDGRKKPETVIAELEAWRQRVADEIRTKGRSNLQAARRALNAQKRAEAQRSSRS